MHCAVSDSEWSEIIIDSNNRHVERIERNGGEPAEDFDSRVAARVAELDASTAKQEVKTKVAATETDINTCRERAAKLKCAFCYPREQRTHGEVKREWSQEWLQFILVCRKHTLSGKMMSEEGPL